jgi:hypothetical protein
MRAQPQLAPAIQRTQQLRATPPKLGYFRGITMFFAIWIVLDLCMSVFVERYKHNRIVYIAMFR